MVILNVSDKDTKGTHVTCGEIHWELSYITACPAHIVQFITLHWKIFMRNYKENNTACIHLSESLKRKEKEKERKTTLEEEMNRVLMHHISLEG